ncbi:MAG: hypothetical protein HC828_14100 [Blastochloris sp.]|nr:hypothetical protein [Blastochloris sp.]
MSDTDAPRTLASNTAGWHVLGLLDGSIQLDFGPFAVAYSRAEFQIIRDLLDAALAPQTETGMIAHAGMQRSVWHGVGRYLVVLVFDAHVYRFRRHELMAFVSLCREAETALGGGATAWRAPCTPPSADDRRN